MIRALVLPLAMLSLKGAGSKLPTCPEILSDYVDEFKVRYCVQCPRVFVGLNSRPLSPVATGSTD